MTTPRRVVLVTGGAGYFGTRLVERLAADGAPVRVLDIRCPAVMPPGVEFVHGDVRDRRAIEQACRDVDVVHHAVALVPLARDREGFWSVNEGGTRAVLEAASAHGVRKVVHLSSSAVYGAPAGNPVTEATNSSPGEDYGHAKLAAERLCWVARAGGLDVTILRPRTILGHGRLGIMQILFEWVRRGAPVPVFDGGRNVYQFVHVDDLVDACLAAGARAGGAEYNIGGAPFGTMADALHGLVRHAGTGSRIVSVPMAPAETLIRWAGAAGLAPLAPYHALMYGRPLWFDCALASRDLGFAPRFGNVEMLCESYDWYLAHRTELAAGGRGSLHSTGVDLRALTWLPKALAWLPTVRS